MAEVQVGVTPTIAASTPAVAVTGLVQRFGDVTAVDHVSLEVAEGEFLALLGPSGCGKTTLLRIIAGLERAEEGSVTIADEDVTRMPPHRRPVNLVFQRYALFPHKTVGENVGFSLAVRRHRRVEIRARVNEMLELVRLEGFADRRIDQLSGGQAQRVALARALVDDPPVVLLDEPLAALDLKLRQAMHVELREIQRRVGSTFIYVTHDQQEAFALSDRVALMNNGRIVQQGSPRDVYRRPSNLFAAMFLGEANIISGPWRREGDAVVVTQGVISVAVSSAATPPGERATVCIRPEDVEVASGHGQGLRGEVLDTTFLGNLVRTRVAVEGATMLVEAPADHFSATPSTGDIVTLTWSADAPVLLADA